MKRISLIAAGLAVCIAVAAQPSQREEGQQPGQHHGQKPKQLTVEQEAQFRVDEMSAALPLTEKQVKKLTKFFKKDITYRRENFQGGGRGPRPEGAPGQGGPRGGQGGMHRGGGPGMGGPGGGMGQSGPRPGGGHGMHPGAQGGRPPMDNAEIDYEKLDKYNAKQEKKLRKILGESLYTQWRSAHPQEQPRLPDLQLDIEQQ